MKTYKNTPKRLSRVFQKYNTPVYFITFNTWHRKMILDNHDVHNALISYANINTEQGRCIGSYVIMPDHVHMFVRLNNNSRLSDFIRLLKQHIGKALKTNEANQPYWQPGFFDHLMRREESYAEKWHYVLHNPVRAGLVEKAIDWPYQGEITRLEF